MIAIALLSAGCFGLGLVLTQFGLRFTTPPRGACVSIPTSASLFLAVSPLTVDFAGWDAGSAGLFALVGCLFPSVVTLMTFEANRRIGPHLTGALGNLTPLFAVAIAAAVLGEVPRLGQWLGIAVIVAGAALLFVAPARGFAAASLIGVALPLAAALVRGLVQPVVKLGLAAWPNPFAATTISYAVSAAVVLGYALARDGRAAFAIPPRGVAWFLAVGVVNGLAVLLMYVALARGPVAVVAPLVACYPIATVGIGALAMRRERLPRPMLIGIAITVFGVALLLAG